MELMAGRVEGIISGLLADDHQTFVCHKTLRSERMTCAGAVGVMSKLTALVNVMPGQIVSRTLAQNKAVSITLFAFDKGTEISTHESTGDAMVQVLEGTGCFTVDGKEYLVHPGEVLVMPANVPHAVAAPEAFKWVLTVVFPEGFKK